MKVGELLEASASREDDAGRIKHKIAALLAKDAEQQRKIYRLFDTYLENQSIHPPKSKGITPKTPILGNWWRRNALPLLLVGIGLLLMVGISYTFILYNLLRVEAQSSLPVINDITGEVGVSDFSVVEDYAPFVTDEIKVTSWDWGDARRDTGEHVRHVYKDLSRSYKIIHVVETARKQMDDEQKRINFIPLCESTISYEIDGFSFKPEAIHAVSEKFQRTWPNAEYMLGQADSVNKLLRFSWDFGDDSTSTERNPNYTYTQKGEYLVTLTTQLWDPIAGEMADCISVDSLRVEVPQIKDLPLVPVSSIEMQLPDISDLVPHKEYWLYLILASIALGLYGLYEFILWRKRRLVLDDKAEQLPPLRQKLRVELPEINLYGNAYFGRVATLLRARRHSEVQDLNVALTLQKSLKNGGEYPEFTYSTRLEASQYLVLIDERNKKDHLARFYESLVRELNHRDITAEYYFYDKDPSLCWKKRSHAVSQISIAQLAATFAGYRLIIIGDGERLLDPHTGELAEYLSVFESWKEKALLSTVPNEDWSRGEDTLAEYFTFLPATEEGWEHLVPQWRLEEKTSPFHWRMQAFEATPPPEDTENLIEELRLYLGEARFQWLCACAVYPILYYELTLQLGERMSGGLLNLESLGHLFRLDWFRKGEIPTEIRLKLIEHLHPIHAKATREFLVEVLKDNPAPEGSLAQKDQQNTLAIYQYLNSARNKEDLEELQKALENLDPEDLEDIVSVKYLSEIKHNPLIIPLPKSFYKGGISLLGTKWKSRLGMVLLSIMVLFLGLWLRDIESIMPNKDFIYQVDDLNLFSQADSARWYHYKGVHFALQEQYDSLGISFQKAEDLGILNTGLKDSFILDSWKGRFNSWLPDYQEKKFNFAGNYELNFLKEYPDTLTTLPDFIPYFFGLNCIQNNQEPFAALRGDVVALSEKSMAIALLNQPDSSFYQGTTPSVFTQEEPESKSALLSHIALAGISAADSKLVSLYKKLGSEFISYELAIRTGDLTGANTDEANIQITIAGAKGIITARLDSSSNGNFQFEKNWRDTWTLNSLMNLGEIEGIEIRLGETGKRNVDDWLIDSLILKTPDANDPYIFVVDSWLGDDRQNRASQLVLRPGSKLVSNNIPDTSIDTNQQIGAKFLQGRVIDQAGNPLERTQIRESFTRTQILSTVKGTFRMANKPVRTTQRNFQLQNIKTHRVNGKTYKGGELRLDTTIDIRNIPPEGLVFVLKPVSTTSPIQEPEQNQAPQQQFKFIRPQMVRVQGGTFMMGKADKDPGHEVQLSSYEIGKFEVTFEEYDLFCEATKREKPEDEGWGRGRRPAIHVSWEDAALYCNWLSEQAGYQPVYTEAKGQYQINYNANGYRLPTEAEWEFAARGGFKMRETIYAGSNDLDSVGWYRENSKSQTHPQGELGANELGIYDMSGNVFEWCGDWYDNSILSKKINPIGAESGSLRVVRGGGWYYGTNPHRVAFRGTRDPADRISSFGFRIARTLSF